MDAVLDKLAASGPLELAAVVLALAYLVLAARINIWCWAAAFVSTAIYLWLFLEQRLYQQSLLQGFYLAMAVYGYRQWHGGARGDGRPITSWSTRQHLIAWAVIVVMTLLTGAIEARLTAARMPYLDAFTTWGSVVTTWMVARKILENWIYWLIVDGVLVYVAFASGLAATAGLFLVYLGIVVVGYFAWRRQLTRSSVAAAA